MDARTALIELLDEAFDVRSWHGTNLRGSIRRVDPKQVVWRSNRHRHNVWELVVHAAYWKYAVRRRLSDEARGSFALEGSNWFERSQPFDRRAWTRDVALLVDEHRRLRAEVAGIDPSRLDTKLSKSPFTVAALIRGAAAHDLYHAGQIQLLKRLSLGK